MAAEDVVFRYRKTKNTTTTGDGPEAPAAPVAFIPGVPLRDLAKADMDSYPPWVREAIKASDLYTAVEAEPKAQRLPRPAEE